ncbi:MAG TPA: fumarylacetoacetate hydrolase family protein [Vicinamibacteria bacterium]|nr:fumarylacetoacetate hydrolase family protein [Vicinamibacteria bacterium]
MRLFRFGDAGSEKPGMVLDNGTLIDVSIFGEDFDEKFFHNKGPRRLARWAATFGPSQPKIAPGSVRLGPPIARPSKLVGIGLNYLDHAKEAKMEVPSEPVIFLKATSAISGPYDDLVIPRGAAKVDWEVELGVVIGQRARYVTEARALDHVAGFLVVNDYSERSFQLERGGQWVKGKSADGFAPLGPFLVSPAEAGNVHDLSLGLTLNGKTMQNSSTANLVFGIPALISYVSQFMTLLPGDVISTGTPAGVGMGRRPPKFLKPGDVIEAGIERLGMQRQRVVAGALR